MSSLELADELEVTRRTILRDVDAMTEAGLPIVVLQGNQGGIELGFNYRTRLTGLSTDEARALAVILSKPMPELDAIGLSKASGSARRKLIESLPDRSRHIVKKMQNELRFEEECVRHKILDQIGDLALSGFDLVGNFVAYRSGHRLNAMLVKALLTEGQVVDNSRSMA